MYYTFFFQFQAMWESKRLCREPLRAKLHEVNKEECRALGQSWRGDECMNAVMKFLSQ